MKTVLGTLQENGVLEMMNITMKKCARNMRFHARFPLYFWVDVINTTIYLIKIGPPSSFDSGIPEEAWIGKRLNYYFRKFFACEAFVHIDKENRTKIEAKSKKCTFIGYGANYFVYHLWDYENHKIIRGRVVVFNEMLMLQGKKWEKENT